MVTETTRTFARIDFILTHFLAYRPVETARNRSRLLAMLVMNEGNRFRRRIPRRTTASLIPTARGNVQ